MLAGDRWAGSLGSSRFFLELDDNFGSSGSGYVGDEMFDVKLILQMLFLYLLLYLINSTVVLTLELSSGVAIIAEYTFFWGFLYLLNFF